MNGAVEDAYPAAEAAAQSIRGSIASVLSIDLVEVKWTGLESGYTPGVGGDYPLRITCSVQAVVTYSVRSGR